jgi:hypothetical protein
MAQETQQFKNPQTDALGSAATSAVNVGMDNAKRIADKIGEDAAINLAQMVSKGQIPEFLQRSMPGIPAPQVMPSAMSQERPPIWPSVEGGGNDNYGLRVAHDKSTLFNNIGAAVNSAVNKHKAEEVAKAQREYEIVLSAMDALRRSNPEDPAQQADIKHNQAILEMFFSDKEKVKRLQKVMGYDAFDPKKEQKKQEDPHYQAYQAALKNKPAIQGTPGFNPNASTPVPIVPAGTNPLAGGNLPATPVNMPADAGTINDNWGGAMVNPTPQEPEWMRLLPDNAKRFASQFPSMPPDPLAGLALEERLIKAGIKPSADKMMDVNKAIIEGKTGIQKEILKSATDIEVAKFRSDSDRYKANMDAASAERVALLNLQGKRIEAETARLRIDADKGKLEFDGYVNLVTGSKVQFELASKKLETLTKAGVDEDDEDVIAAKREMVDAQKGFNLALRNMTEFSRANGIYTAGLGNDFKIDTPEKAQEVVNTGGKQLVPTGGGYK